MSNKITLDGVVSGYDLSKINANFQKIQNELNNRVLYRSVEAGETNTLEDDLDINGKTLYNIGDIALPGHLSLETIVADTEAARDEAAASAVLSASYVNSLSASDGATKIGFVHAGTGAVPQTVDSVLKETVTPMRFGAVGNGVADDTVALQKAFDYVFSNNGAYTLDLAGRKYMTTAPIVGTSSYQFYKRTIRNGWIEAKSTFVGSYLIDFSASYSGNQVTDFRMVDVTLQGGAAGAGSAGTYYADGAIIFGETYGVTLLNCILQGFNGAIVKSSDTGAANEINLIACRIAGLGTYPIGIDLAGNDNLISNCLIRECIQHIRFRKGANTVIGSHLYNFEKPASAGIVCDYARQIQLIGNYIDTVWVELTDPQDCIINSNKFLLPNGSTNSGWVAGTQAFIDIIATTSWSLVNFSVQENSFVCLTSTAPDSIRKVSGTLTNYEKVFVKNNTFSNVIQRASHIRLKASITSALSQTIDFSNYAFGGNAFQYGIAGFQGATGGPVNRVSRSGNVFTVTLGSSSTGIILVDASMNIDGQ